MRPHIQWRAGSPRKSPVGRSLGGKRTDSYWSKSVTPGWTKVPNLEPAERAVSRLVRRLAPHKRFLAQVRGSGGSVEIWLSTYGTSIYSFVASPQQILELSATGATLVIDIYPDRQKLQ